VHQEGALAASLRRAFEATEASYERVLRWVLANKWKTVGLTVLVLVASFGAASRLGAEFVAPEDRSQFLVDLQLPDSASLTETEARTAEAEALVQRIAEVTDVYAIVGLNGDVNKSRLRVLTKAKHERSRGIFAIKEEARGLLAPALVATQVNLADPPVIEGLGDYYPIMVRIVGPDLAVLNAEAERVARILRELPGTADIRVESNPPKPELAIQIDRARANDVDLNAAGLALQLRLAISGDVAAKLREGTDETDIRVRLSEKDRGTPERVRQLEVFTPRGLRPVSDVARVELQNGPSVIEHENRERQIAVYAQLSGGAALGAVSQQLKARVAERPLPAGYSVVYDGQMKSMAEQNEAFGIAFSLAFVFIYMVLASQFESFKHPFTIMVSLPLALVGALLGLVVSGFNVGMGAMIGVILLMGLVTKNAILLVDGALQHLRAGDSVDEALLKAGPRRLRPILMTSAAMAIGMVPTAIGKGVGSEFRAPMAIAVIGGVITSTFLTLLVVPVVFAGMEKLRLRRRPNLPSAPPSAPSGEAPASKAA
jgi:multidrug efflux pump subunit AcrB